MTGKISARPYQLEAIRATKISIEKGHRRNIIKLPTGAGKTFTAILAVKDFSRTYAPKGGDRFRVLWLAHRHELIEQPKEDFGKSWPEATVGVVKAERNEWAADVVIASVQTLRLRLDDGENSEQYYDAIVVDEAHHGAAKSYLQVLDFYQNKTPPAGHQKPLVIGLTATPDRPDGLSLKCAFDAISYDLSIDDAIDGGYLCRAAPIKAVLPDLHLENVRINRQGDYQEAELAAELLRAGVAEATAKVVIEHASGRKTLVFTVSVDQAQRTSDALVAKGVSSDWVAGVTKRRDREQKLQAYKEAENSVLCSAMLLTEGLDIPSVDCIVVARPTRNSSLYIQMIGRGLRRCEGKKDCLVIDIVGAHQQHGLTAGSQIGGAVRKDKQAGPGEPREPRDRMYSCTGSCRSLSHKGILEEGWIVWIAPPPAGPGFCPECGSRVREAGQGEMELSLLSSLLRASRSAYSEEQREFDEARWIPCLDGIVALPAGDVTFVAYRLPGGDYALEAMLRQRKNRFTALYSGPLALCQAIGLDLATRENALEHSDVSATWRKKRPTHGHLAALAQWTEWTTVLPMIPGPYETAGEVSDEITKIIVGHRYSMRLRQKGRKSDVGNPTRTKPKDVPSWGAPGGHR